MGKLRFRFIIFILVLNELFELGKRCQDVPTKIIRVKIGPLNGDVNVAEIYHRVKKNALNKCVLNSTHYEDNGNEKLITDLAEIDLKMNNDYKDAMEISIYVFVDMEYWNSTLEGLVRPFFFIKFDDIYFKIMDPFSYREFIIEPKFVKKAIKFKGTSLANLPGHINYDHLKEKFTKEIPELYKNRDIIELYYQTDDQEIGVRYKHDNPLIEQRFVYVKPEISGGNSKKIYRVEFVKQINGEEIVYLKEINSNKRVYTSNQHIEPIGKLKSIIFNQQFEYTDGHQDFHDISLDRTEKILNEKAYSVEFSDDYNQGYVPIYFIQSWEYSDENNHSILITNEGGKVYNSSSEQPEPMDFFSYSYISGTDKVEMFARFQTFKDLTVIPQVNNGSEILVYYQCARNSFKFEPYYPESIEVNGIAKSIYLWPKLKPEYYLPLNLDNIPSDNTEIVTTTIKSNPGPTLVNVEATPNPIKNSQTTTNTTTTITTSTTTTTTRPTIGKTEVIENQESSKDTPKQDVYTENTGSVPENPEITTLNNHYPVEKVTKTCQYNGLHETIRRNPNILRSLNPKNMLPEEWDTEMNIKYTKANNNSLYAFVNLEFFDKSLTKQYMAFLLIETDGYNYRVADSDILNEFIIPKEYIGKIIYVKMENSTVSIWPFMLPIVKENFRWIAAHSDRIEEYFKTINYLKTNEARMLDDPHNLTSNMFGGISSNFVKIEKENCENTICFKYIKYDTKRYKTLAQDIIHFGFIRNIQFNTKIKIENQFYDEMNYCIEITTSYSQLCGEPGRFIIEIPNFFIKRIIYIQANNIGIYPWAGEEDIFNSTVEEYNTEGVRADMFPKFYRIIPTMNEKLNLEPINIPINEMKLNELYICENEESRKELTKSYNDYLYRYSINLNITEEDYFDLTIDQIKESIDNEIHWRNKPQAIFSPIYRTEINHRKKSDDIQKRTKTQMNKPINLNLSSIKKSTSTIPIVPPYEHSNSNNNLPLKTEEKRDTLSETSSNYGYMFKVTKAYKPLEEEFSKPGYIVRAASFGLTFSRTGRAYKFSDFWEQYLRIEGPRLNTETFKLFKDNLYQVCEEMGRKIADQAEKILETHRKKRADPLRFISREANYGISCKRRVDDVHREVIQQMENILTTRYLQFKRTNIDKRKREIFTAMLITAGVSLAAGFFLGKNNDDNEKEIENLSNRMENNEKRTELLAQQMIGMSHLNNARFKEVDEKIQYLANTTKTAFKNMQEHYDKIFHGIQNEIQILTLKSDIQNLIFREADKLQNMLMLYLEDFRFWDNIFITLRKGLLPRELFDSFTLNNLLDQIEHKLKGDYLIALDKEDYVLFYNLPFVSYIVKNEEQNGTTKNYLYLKIKIPLKKNMEQNLYHIIHPSSSPFPCLNNGCF